MEGPLKLWGGRVTLEGGGGVGGGGTSRPSGGVSPAERPEAGAILVATEEEACVGSTEEPLASRYADVCGRMLTHAHVCGRMLLRRW